MKNQKFMLLLFLFSLGLNSNLSANDGDEQRIKPYIFASNLQMDFEVVFEQTKEN